jgi:hypothetical protein
MVSNFLALLAERIAEKVADRIAQEIPGAVKAIADSIIEEIGQVAQVPRGIADSILDVINLGN